MTLPDVLAAFDRAERDRQPITAAMWNSLLATARKSVDPSTGAAAIERAAILRYLTVVRRRIPGTPGFTAAMQLLFGVFVDEMARNIESNAHHRSTP